MTMSENIMKDYKMRISNEQINRDINGDMKNATFLIEGSNSKVELVKEVNLARNAQIVNPEQIINSQDVVYAVV